MATKIASVMSAVHGDNRIFFMDIFTQEKLRKFLYGVMLSYLTDRLLQKDYWQSQDQKYWTN